MSTIFSGTTPPASLIVGLNMKFIDTHIDKANRFSIGREIETGRFYLSIPVSNQLVDYEEYYEITKGTHDGYPENINELIEFADECRLRRCDHLLLIKPGKDRGVG